MSPNKDETAAMAPSICPFDMAVGMLEVTAEPGRYGL